MAVTARLKPCPDTCLAILPRLNPCPSERSHVRLTTTVASPQSPVVRKSKSLTTEDTRSTRPPRRARSGQATLTQRTDHGIGCDGRTETLLQWPAWWHWIAMRRRWQDCGLQWACSSSFLANIRCSDPGSRGEADFNSGSTAFWRTARIRSWRRCLGISYCRMARRSHSWWLTASLPSGWHWRWGSGCERPAYADSFT